jgi:hypothetical protein
MQLHLEIPQIDAYLSAAEGGVQRASQTPALTTGVAKPCAAEPTSSPMSVVYIKLALDRDNMESYSVQVREHARRDARFPQDPTSNQAFTTEQFVAYRELGHHLAAGVPQAIAAV